MSACISCLIYVAVLQLWIIPSLLGSSLLHFHSEDQWERLSAWVYGAGLSSLFIISTLFHTVSWKKSHLRYVCTPDEVFLIWQGVNFPSDAGAKAPRGTAESVMCSRTHWCDMYKQCHSVVTRLFGLSAGLWSTVSTCVTGWWFISSLPPPTPRGKQPGPLLHMHVRVHVYVCRIWTLSEVMHCFFFFCWFCFYLGSTCASWVPGRVTCAGWSGSWLRLEQPTFSSSMRGQFVRILRCWEPLLHLMPKNNNTVFSSY